MQYPEKIWVGPTFTKQRLFVVGQSWYGQYKGDLATDDGYIREYVDDRIKDSMYTRLESASGMSRREFWEGVMFTNFVQWTGP